MKNAQRKKQLLDAVRGSLVGAAIGDALGMPVESMTRKEIMAATGGKGVRGYIAPLQTRIKDTIGLAPGSTTDDTQLMLAVARSLIRKRRFWLEDQARELVREFDRKTFGWGGTTTVAAEELKLWFESKGKQGRGPEEMTPKPKKAGESLGTGPAMKVEPLAIFTALRSGMDGDRLVIDVLDHGFLTHGDPRASIAALSVAAVIAPAMWSFLPQCENDMTANGGPLRTARFFVPAIIENAEKRCASYEPSPPTYSSCLELAMRGKNVGTGYSSLCAVPTAVAIFFRNPAKFRRGVLEAVNAGGDTDTMASMVGGMVGAHLGLSAIPSEWIKDLRDAEKIIAIADKLVDAALS